MIETRDEYLIESSKLCWSTTKNSVYLADIITSTSCFMLEGPKLPKIQDTYVKCIRDSRLLVHSCRSLNTAAFEIYDTSPETPKAIFSSGRIQGEKKSQGLGNGDIAYNAKRSLLALIPIQSKFIYHLVKIEDHSVTLWRKTKWHDTHISNITGLDLDPTGKHMASIDDHGTLLISEVDTNAYSTHYSLQSIEHSAGHQCKWTKDANLYVSYNGNKINVFDPEKRALLYENAVKPGYIHYMDVCPTDNNLVALSCGIGTIVIIDRRGGEIVAEFDVHEDHINCVKWSLGGDLLGTAASDRKVKAKVIDFGTGDVIFKAKISGEGLANSVCFF